MKNEFTFTTIRCNLKALVGAVLMLFCLSSFAQENHHGSGKDKDREKENHRKHHAYGHERRCEADFRHVRDTVVNGILFFAVPNAHGTTYSWDFGDGSTSALRNPEHIYQSSGTYLVCLTVTDSAFKRITCSDTDCDSVRVQVICNTAFRTVPDSTFLGVHFLSAANYSITEYSWDFGDGSTSNERSPVHVYGDTGTYHVCLAVTDAVAGDTLCTDTNCNDIHIGVTCNAHFRAEMEGDEDADDTTLVVEFRNARNLPGTTYAWDFGDGSTSSLPGSIHIFADTGNYVVCLTVTDSVAGQIFCQDSFCDTLHVTGGGDNDWDRDRLGSQTNPDNRIHVIIYPNPVISSAVVRVEGAGTTTILKVYESTGRLVITKSVTNGDYQLNRNEFHSGLYFYEVNNSQSGTVRGKLMIQ